MISSAEARRRKAAAAAEAQRLAEAEEQEEVARLRALAEEAEARRRAAAAAAARSSLDSRDRPLRFGRRDNTSVVREGVVVQSPADAPAASGFWSPGTVPAYEADGKPGSPGNHSFGRCSEHDECVGRRPSTHSPPLCSSVCSPTRDGNQHGLFSPHLRPPAPLLVLRLLG